MNNETHKKATDNLANQLKIERELEIWEKELTKKHKLGYLQGWNNNHAVSLETGITEEIFTGFRCAAMDNLKLKLAWLKSEFNNL